jgi:WW domain-containing oxidoreductase
MTEWSRFDRKSTADEIVEGLDLSGRCMIVTGANTGIGFESARALASAGARVVFACRNEEAGRAAVDRALARHPGARAEFSKLDLASFDSIREFAARHASDDIDVLVCNAGVVNTHYHEVESGFEHTVGVCHLGHFLLTQLLLPSLQRSGTGRVVMVSSESHRQPKALDFDKLPLTRETFSMLESYGQAKLCNLLFSNELHRRHFEQGLSACALHPGNLVTTDIGRGSIWMRIGMLLASPFTKTANQGAATIALCAAHPDASEISGHYFSHCQQLRPSRESQDATVAEKLWKLSETWVDASPGNS